MTKTTAPGLTPETLLPPVWAPRDPDKGRTQGADHEFSQHTLHVSTQGPSVTSVLPFKAYGASCVLHLGDEQNKPKKSCQESGALWGAGVLEGDKKQAWTRLLVVSLHDGVRSVWGELPHCTVAQCTPLPAHYTLPHI